MKKHLAYAALILAALPAAARARDLGDVTSYFRNVEVNPGDTAQDIVCIYCSIRVAGNVSMDLVAIGGDIEVQGKVTMDAVAVGGGVKLGPGAEVSGDAISLGGALEVGPQAKVGGESKSAAWFYLPGQRGVSAFGALTFVGTCIVIALMLALILRAARLGNIAAALRKRPGWTIVSGIIAFTLWVFALSIAEDFGRAEDFVVRIVIGLGFVLFTAGLAGLSFGLGARFLKPTLLRVLAGSISLALPQLVPLLGVAVFLAIMVVAPGAAIVSGFGGGAEWLPTRFRRGVREGGTSKPAVP